ISCCSSQIGSYLPRYPHATIATSSTKTNTATKRSVNGPKSESIVGAAGSTSRGIPKAFAQRAFRDRATTARAPRRRGQGHRGVGSLSHAAELHLAPATYDPTALHPVSHDARPRRRPYSGQANRLHLGVSPTVNVFSDANTALLVVAKMTALGMLICSL